MHVNRRVVSNTSPILNLALINELDLLDRQFSSVDIPEEVWDELMAGDSDAESIIDANQRDILNIVSVERDELYIEISRELDLGETAAITHAIHTGADLVLIDERDGRTVARRHDLTVTGVIGILLKASEEGSVDMKDRMDRLRTAGFWIADDLYEEVLARKRDDF